VYDVKLLLDYIIQKQGNKDKKEVAEARESIWSFHHSRYGMYMKTLGVQKEITKV